MKKIKLTENQSLEALKCLNKMLKEDLNPNNDITIAKTNQTPAEKSNPVAALTSIAKTAKSQGIDTNRPGLHMSTDANVGGTKMKIVGTPTNNTTSTTSVSEQYIITKEQLDRARLHNIKENSHIVKVKDFLK